jgi:DNA-binding IclR family transcriptional regulator
VYRLAEGTTAIGFTENLPDSRIGSTRRFLHLADAAVRSIPEWTMAQGVLDRISEETGLTAYLSVPRTTEAICLAWAPGQGIDLLALKPGRSLPLYAGAAGRCILAFTPDAASLVAELAPFPPLTPRTLTTADELLADIENSREKGYVVSDEDVTIDIGAVGMPIMRSGRLAGCLSVGGLATVVQARVDELRGRIEAGISELVDA